MSRLSVVVGGGGVGKTTTSAACGLAMARRGRRTLVVTVDPARRLADALGVQLGIESSRVEMDGVELFARMPDARGSVDLFARWLFAEQPEAGERFRKNALYRELRDSVAGIHELISIGFLEHELQSGRWDEVVLDTAPSRHALDLLDVPARLARMLDGPALEWVASLARFAGAGLEDRPGQSRLLSWGKARVGQLVGHLVGVEALRSIAAFFAELGGVRGRWLSLVEHVERRLSDASTRYLIVAGPSGSSLDDAEFLHAELIRRGTRPHALVLNGASTLETWPEALSARLPPGHVLSDALDTERRASAARASQSQAARQRLERGPCRETTLHVLPRVPSVLPEEILRQLAEPLGELAS